MEIGRTGTQDVAHPASASVEGGLRVSRSPGQPSLARSQAYARERADKRDAKWFTKRPFAYLRVRGALPFEQIVNGEDGSRVNPFVIVRLLEDRSGFERSFFYAVAMPDEDHATLSAILETLELLHDSIAETGGAVCAPDELMQRTAERAEEIKRLFPNQAALNAKVRIQSTGKGRDRG